MELRIKTNKVFEHLSKSAKRIKSERGGTRSGKTYNILIFLIILAVNTDPHIFGKKIITIARQTMPSLRATAMRDFFEILDTLNLYDEKNHHKTNNEYVLNGHTFEFIGLTESKRVRGRKRHICYINEANETDYETFFQLNIRTTESMIIDYNPSDTYSWIYDQVETREDCDLLVTTFLDNPFLEQQLVAEILLLKDASPEYWKIYGEGMVAGNQKLIWSHWKITSEANYPFERGEKILGLDFGHTAPSALVEVNYWENTLYWRELLYQAKLTNSQLIEKLKFIPEAHKYPIFADCAEPDRIQEIVEAGFDCRPAYKNHKTTIDFVRSKPIRILDGSANILREIKKYSWKTDKNGNIIDGEVVDFDNHSMDAGRYASYQFGQINGWDFN
jgi:phage terminase large subunit